MSTKKSKDWMIYVAAALICTLIIGSVSLGIRQDRIEGENHYQLQNEVLQLCLTAGGTPEIIPANLATVRCNL